MKCEDVSAEIDVILQDPDDRAVFQRLEAHFKQCEACRKEHGDIINTAAKISEVGQISDIVDMSDKFIEETKKEAEKESDRHRIGTIRSSKNKLDRKMDLVIMVLLAGTVLAAVIILILAIIYIF